MERRLGPAGTGIRRAAPCLARRAQAYLTGYLIEKSLSVDNVFVYALIFAMFSIPARHQHRVLMYGIIGALILRGAFIAGGAALLDSFHPAVYLFGALLIYAAAKTFRQPGEQIDPARSLPLRLLRRVIPAASQLQGRKFVVRQGGRRVATPLLTTLLLIETADVIFAADSIPAVFGVTRDAFVVFTSNVFALLGMRALYFLFAGAAARLRYLQAGLGVVLAGVGTKMLLSDLYEIPTWASLIFIAVVLLATVGASWLADRRPHEAGPGAQRAVEDDSGANVEVPVTGDLADPDAGRTLQAECQGDNALEVADERVALQHRIAEGLRAVSDRGSAGVSMRVNRAECDQQVAVAWQGDRLA